MKKIYFLMGFVFLSLPVWADDDLIPEPLEQAVTEYEKMQSSAEIDTMNHEVWKIYILTTLSPTGGYDKTPKLLIGSLVPFGSYRVMLKINQLYNYLQPSPKPGDVIVVDGRVKGKYNYHISTQNHEYTLEALSMNVEGAVALPKERFDPDAGPVVKPAVSLPPTPTPGGHR